MAVYLKLEETMGDQHLSMRDDLMGLSLLALLLSPWAGLGLILSAFEISFMTPAFSLTCTLVLLAAVPKALQLLLPENLSAKQTLT